MVRFTIRRDEQGRGWALVRERATGRLLGEVELRRQTSRPRGMRVVVEQYWTATRWRGDDRDPLATRFGSRAEAAAALVEVTP